MASAKIKADLVELARAYMSGGGFRQEVINTMPASVIYSFEEAMETALVSDEGLSTFKTQWDYVYRKAAKAWAKKSLSATWAHALEVASDFVGRENAAENDGQKIFDDRYRHEYALLNEQVMIARRLAGPAFEDASARLIEQIGKLILKVEEAKTSMTKVRRVKKPGSAAARGKGNHGHALKSGGGKKRGVKGRHKK